MELWRAIESSKLLVCSPIVSVTQLPAKNGAAAAVVQQSLGSTVVVTTRYGMLLVLFRFGLDATTAESVMNFIKGFMGEQGDTMSNVMTVDEVEHARVVELEDQQRLLYALREIAENSDDAEAVKVALVTLATTTIGASYLKENPITL
jgi:hypothetical protein